MMKNPAILPNDLAQTLKVADALQYSSSSVVSRTLLQTPEVRVVLFAFSDEQELKPHVNNRRAFIQILEGVCSFLFVERWQRLEAGTFLHLPPGHPHAVRASEGPFAMLLTLGAEPAATSSASCRET
jgi:quercetin dioxygenase-like cupin family protein